MALDVSTLVNALPREADLDERTGDDALAQLLAGLARKPVPVGALTRMWALGSIQAKVAAAYFVYWIRSSFSSQEERERRLNETHLAAAIKVLGGMSYMRGMIMKVGQILSSYPNVVPREFFDVLGRLQFDAPPMHFSLLREMVRQELGRDPEDVFAEFDTNAMAAASLGQVHRARLRSGEQVAVKIQYPGIARAIQTDFRNMLALLTPMRLSGDWDNLRMVFDDARQMVEMETDYEREATFLERARAAFHDDEDIVIPKPHRAYSSKRVLVMDHLDGVHIDRYLATNPSQAERDRFGRLIMLASFRTAHGARIWYADSNPGNYLFLNDGRLGVIDFGCCREFSPQEWEYYVDVCRSYHEGGDAMRRVLYRAIDVPEGDPSRATYVEYLERLMEWMSGYLKHEGLFDFGDEAFMQRGLDLIAEATKNRWFRSLPLNMWINRQLMGLRALAHRLGARIDMKTLSEQESRGVYS